MSKTLMVTVKQSPKGIEGIYQLPNSTSSKLATKSGCTIFPNAGSLTQAAKRFASSIGWQAQLNEPQKKAAKKNASNKNTCSKKPAAKNTCNKKPAAKKSK